METICEALLDSTKTTYDLSIGSFTAFVAKKQLLT